MKNTHTNNPPSWGKGLLTPNNQIYVEGDTTFPYLTIIPSNNRTPKGKNHLQT